MKHPNKTELRILQRFAEQTAKKAGEILKKGFTKNKDVRYKGVIDPVTKYDLASENCIIKAIEQNYPEHGILGEEGSDKKTGSPYRWVIDPLDGTVNYSHRFPIYSVSIALQFEGNTIIGVVYDPHVDELFSAATGCGANLNKKKITVTTEKKLARSLLATGFAYNIKSAKRNNLGMFARMMKEAQAVRRLGSAALDLCWLAAGRLDGFWEYYLHPWDTAAAMLIVTEAGGKVTTIDGTAYDIDKDSILASNSLIHNQMETILLRGRKK